MCPKSISISFSNSVKCELGGINTQGATARLVKKVLVEHTYTHTHHIECASPTLA